MMGWRNENNIEYRSWVNTKANSLKEAHLACAEYNRHSENGGKEKQRKAKTITYEHLRNIAYIIIRRQKTPQGRRSLIEKAKKTML